MSPEQCEGKELDARSDLYSIGIILYEMLTGKVPYEGETLSIMYRQVHEAPPSLGKLAPHVSADIVRIIECFLSKNSDERPENATEARALLAAKNVYILNGSTLTVERAELINEHPATSSEVKADGNDAQLNISVSEKDNSSSTFAKHLCTFMDKKRIHIAIIASILLTIAIIISFHKFMRILDIPNTLSYEEATTDDQVNGNSSNLDAPRVISFVTAMMIISLMFGWRLYKWIVNGKLSGNIKARDLYKWKISLLGLVTFAILDILIQYLQIPNNEFFIRSFNINYYVQEIISIAVGACITFICICIYHRGISIDEEAYFTRGRLKIRIQNYSGAIDDFSQSIKLNPGYENAYLWRGKARYNLQDCSGAVKDFNQALELNENAMAFFWRGKAKFNLQDSSGAVEDITQAIKLNPEFAMAYYYRGNLKSYLQKDDEANEDFAKAAELDPKYEEDYYHYEWIDEDDPEDL